MYATYAWDMKQELQAPKNISDKEKKKRYHRKSGRRYKDDNEMSSWQRFRQDYQEKLNEIKDDSTFYVHGRYVKFAKQSLGFFTNKNQVRIFMVWLTTSKWFDRAILLLIILNSICLGVKDYTDTENVSRTN